MLRFLVVFLRFQSVLILGIKVAVPASFIVSLNSPFTPFRSTAIPILLSEPSCDTPPPPPPSLSYDRSIVSSKPTSPHSAI
jgi:hypothetical protein